MIDYCPRSKRSRLLLPGERPGLTHEAWRGFIVAGLIEIIAGLALGYYIGGGCVGGLP